MALTPLKAEEPIWLERATRIELAFSAWEADVLPLNYARKHASCFYTHYRMYP